MNSSRRNRETNGKRKQQISHNSLNQNSVPTTKTTMAQDIYFYHKQQIPQSKITVLIKYMTFYLSICRHCRSAFVTLIATQVFVMNWAPARQRLEEVQHEVVAHRNQQVANEWSKNETESGIKKVDHFSSHKFNHTILTHIVAKQTISHPMFSQPFSTTQLIAAVRPFHTLLKASESCKIQSQLIF